MAPNGPPYASQIAEFGGVPTLSVDAPISVIFVFLYVLGATIHMTIFQANKKKRHKFLMSGMLFGFCLSRTTTMILRIAIAAQPLNINLSIAGEVFLTAGVALLLAINLIFAQRLFQASHPNAGFNILYRTLFRTWYATIPVMVLSEIISTIMSYETLSEPVLLSFTILKRFADVFFTVTAFLPAGILLLSFAIPGTKKMQKFGTGKHRSKVAILLLSSALLLFGGAFKTVRGFNVRPKDDPGWFNSIAWFYLTNFLIEIVVVYLYAAVRVDQRFYVPARQKAQSIYGNAETDTRISYRRARRSSDSVMHRPVMVGVLHPNYYKLKKGGM